VAQRRVGTQTRRRRGVVTIAPVPDRVRNVLVIALGAAALLLSMWVANQGGAAPVFPARFAASILILAESLPVVAATWVAAIGLGWPVRVLLFPQSPFRSVAQAGAGMAALLLVNWLMAWAGGVGVAWAWSLVGVGIVAAAAQAVVSHRRPAPDRPAASPRLPMSLVLAAIPLGGLLVAVTLPPGTLWRIEAYGYDVLSYHLQIPREWLEAGAMTALPHNVYAYLPSLIEAGYVLVASLGGGDVVASVYVCQLFHASLAVYAAVAVGCAVAQLTTASAGVMAAAVMLSVPWVLVTGSLAYNEMAVLAFGGAAVLLLLDIRSERPRVAAAIGLLVAAATLAKPTAGPMLAVPIGLVLLTRLNHAERWRSPPELRRAMLAAAVAAGVGVLVLSPWFVRNYTWTGNPVFPFAAGVIGAGHWDAALVERWDRGHGLTLTTEEPRLEALARQWLFNTGFGAAGGEQTPREVRNIARFPNEYGWPVLWIAVLLGALFTVRQVRQRRAVGAMLLVLGVQLLFWLAATHLQSRFLVPTILPAAVIVGLGVARAQQVMSQRLRWVTPVAVTALVLSMTVTGQSLMSGQLNPHAARVMLGGLIEGGHVTPQRAERIEPAPWLLVDTLPLVSATPLDDLPPGSRVLLVADNSALLYVAPPIVYNTAFDANPLGAVIREVDGDGDRVTEALAERGITHVWVHWSELDRLHSTYGFDSDVTEPVLRELATRWRVVSDAGIATLYRLR
jgi:hypothetical protein